MKVVKFFCGNTYSKEEFCVIREYPDDISNDAINSELEQIIYGDNLFSDFEPDNFDDYFTSYYGYWEILKSDGDDVMSDFDRVCGIIDNTYYNYEQSCPDPDVDLDGYITIWNMGLDSNFQLWFNPDGSFQKIVIND